MRWFSRTNFSKASWPPFWHSAIRSLSSGATITLIFNYLTILRDKSFETSVKLNARRIEKLHPCRHHSHHREGAFPKLNRLVYNCRVGSKTIAPQPFTQENDITAVGIFLFGEKLTTENGPNAQQLKEICRHGSNVNHHRPGLAEHWTSTAGPGLGLGGGTAEGGR